MMRELIGIVLAMVLGVAVAQEALNEAPDGVRRVLIESEAEGGPRQLLVELNYDADGNRVERRTFAHSFADGALLRTDVERYAPDGELLLRERFDGDGEVLEQTLARTDDRGRVVERLTYDAEGAVASRWVARTDDAGRIVGAEVYADDVLVRRDEAVLDAEDRIVGSRSLDAAGNLVSEERRDPDSGTIEVTSYRDGTAVATSIQRFDAAGAPTHAIVTAPDGTVINEVIQTYGERGRLVEQVSRQLGADGLATTVARYAYEDDADGYWIVRRRLGADGAVLQTFYRSFSSEAP